MRVLFPRHPLSLAEPHKHSLTGFTLIELLVVIAIIGLIASMVFASLTSARIKARDARRAADMHTIQLALELYVSDYGHYPNTGGAWTSFDAPQFVANDIVNPNAADLAAALVKYLPTPPTDPKNLGTDSGYDYFSDGTNMCVIFWRTPENMLNFSQNLWDIAPFRCGAVGSNGQCTSGANAIFIGAGTGAVPGGC
ncbi:MAG: hypothetical protein A3C11_00130 [Candidatus Sungbacteria bacterium RIFCSPHIGHO2_02_FULL_49_12]|uniref:Type II secretion system protein GspG C-terminal domain-containing protein n=1 Tax=Candidatus Sungbacteria bacterium RIFCSPHIGHO2_02_FULL_49_12 TaxID=1802271 RepID=A0A1G2KTL4_9BACT|nr:MAG: hypothetical protein A3C11_00130 [Candidatus Sungbacteria bacterium RIFCSPHIGHO2_02_FULL_49_12]